MDKLHKEIKRFDSQKQIAEASMPPSSWYTSPDIFELEKTNVLYKNWFPIGRLDQFKKPGDYRSGCYLGAPWVVVKGDDGELRGFHNVCSHKGREVVTGNGHSESQELVCGYHAWKYDFSGKLKAAPRIAGIKNFDKEQMKMKPLALEVWGHWVFVNISGDAVPLKEQLGELMPKLDQRSWSDFEFVATKNWEIDANWKVVVDNYLDGGYHIPHMHPSLDGQLSMDSYSTECFERFSIQSSFAGAGSETLGVNPQQRIGDGAIYAWIHPNLMINLYGNAFDVNWVIPVDENRCQVIYEFFFLHPNCIEAQKFIEKSIAQSDVTQKEDIEICESVQRGLQSPAYDTGRYAPSVETGEYHFHRLLAEELSVGLNQH